MNTTDLIDYLLEAAGLNYTISDLIDSFEGDSGGTYSLEAQEKLESAKVYVTTQPGYPLALRTSGVVSEAQLLEDDPTYNSNFEGDTIWITADGAAEESPYAPQAVWQV